MTETYRVVKKGEQYEELDDAKRAAKQMPLEPGQMHAVVDEINMVKWKGGVKATAKRALKRTA
jgi:hypothetical protein